MSKPIFTTLPKPEKVEPLTDEQKRNRRTALIGGLAVAGGVSLAGTYGVLKLHERLSKSLAAKSAERDLGKKLKEVFAKQAAEQVSQIKHPPFSGRTAKEFQPPPSGVIEHHYTQEARRHYTEATQKHLKLIPYDEKMKDWKYYARPYDAENKPRPGKYMPPEDYDRKVNAWRLAQERKRTKAMVDESKAQKLRDEISQARHEGRTKMERLLRPIEFDVTLKEGRDAGGKFSSGSAPMISPRDMQAAYHGPGGKQPQPKQPNTESKSKFPLGKAAIIGGGAALGLGYLALRAPAIKKKILGQAIEEAQEKTATTGAGEKIGKRTREALQFKHNEQLRAQQDAAKARLESTVSRMASEAQVTQAGLKKDLANAQAEGNAHLTVRTEVEKELATEKEAHQKTQDLLKSQEEAIAGTLGGPVILGPDEKPLNPLLRAAHTHAKNIIVQGEEIESAEGAHKAFRERLVGKEVKGRPMMGLIERAAVNLKKHQDKLAELRRTGGTTYQITKKEKELAIAKTTHKRYSELLTDLDKGALTHSTIRKELDPIIVNEARAQAKKSLNKEIKGIADQSTRNRKQARIEAKQKAREEAEEKKKMDELTKSDPNWPGHSYKAKAPKSKNPGKQFEDARLATRLCSALQNVPSTDLHELSSFVRDVEVKHLPTHVQKEIARFVKVKPGMKVSHYSMTAGELMGKADPHNMASARLNIEKSGMSQKAARAEVKARREHKMVLIMNDRIVDGHHFTGKADYGKVSSSLHVLDLTPTRFQMEALQPGMIEMARGPKFSFPEAKLRDDAWKIMSSPVGKDIHSTLREHMSNFAGHGFENFRVGEKKIGATGMRQSVIWGSHPRHTGGKIIPLLEFEFQPAMIELAYGDRVLNQIKITNKMNDAIMQGAFGKKPGLEDLPASTVESLRRAVVDNRNKALRGWSSEYLNSRSVIAEALRKVRKMSLKPIGPKEGTEVMRTLFKRENIRVPKATRERNEAAIRRHFPGG